jgi:hypothetical protein
VGRGSHRELAEAGGPYATLYERQFRSDIDFGDLTAVGS